jgi:large subunit ribosomal protein L21
MYAIIRTGGKQYRVREGDRIAAEHLDAEEGSDVTLDDVLLIDNDGTVSVGAPNVAGASVAARVTQHVRSDKVLVFKYKNKTRRRQLRGHRQPLTQLTITSITAG